MTNPTVTAAYVTTRPAPDPTDTIPAPDPATFTWSEIRLNSSDNCPHKHDSVCQTCLISFTTEYYYKFDTDQGERVLESIPNFNTPVMFYDDIFVGV